MTTSRPDTETIFHAAREIPDPDHRREYVREACGEDEDRIARIEALLAAADDGPDNLLDCTAAGTLIASILQPTTESPGTVIGSYKLIEPIGEGGMGTVWMAQQNEPVKRVVAVKLIKAGMDSRQVIARFEAERQALALMDHPNIARVLDGGTTSGGRPYFVMDFVKGQPITEYCDAKRLGVRDRLELFGDVCRAVQHAHQKGIIHRDLKPSNVLVAPYDGKPVVKVIDFGVAKAIGQRLTEATLFTGFGTVVGTPEYMSPEQAEINNQDIDTRSDIYSLGVLLYELLTGSTPLTKKRVKEAALLEVLRVIREEEPAKPSTRLSSTQELPSISARRDTEPAKLTKLVRGELDWIAMKALEKDRIRRYETANGLAMDVLRYLRDEPVTACPPSAGYRLRKFARRNKTALLTVLLLAAALFLGIVISTWQALRARRAETLSQLRFVAEQDARRRAVTEAARATAISALLQQALQAADPYKAKGADYTVRQLLDDLSRGLGDRLKDQPEAEAAIRSTIGIAYCGLGRPEDAEPHLRRALDLRRAVLGPDHPEVAQTLLDHSYCAFQMRELTTAEAEAREALALCQKANAKPERTLTAFGLIAFFLAENGKPVESRAVADQALAFARDAGCAEHPEVAKILHNQVQVRIFTGDFADAEQLARKALTIHRRVNGADHPETGWGLYKLGVALEQEGKHAEAEKTLREALTIFRKHFDESRILLVEALLKEALRAQGNVAGAAELRAEETVRLRRAIEQQGGNSSLRVLLGNHLRDAGDLDRAIAEYSEVITRDPTFVDAWIARGECRLLRREHARAAEDFTAALRLKQDRAEAWSGQGHVHHDLAQWDSAVADYTRAIALAPQFYKNWFDRGRAHVALRQWDQAVADLSKAMELNPNGTGEWFYRGEAHMGLRQWDKAIVDYSTMIEREPGDFVCWCRAATLYLYTADVERYRGACRAILDRFERRAAEDATLSDFVARTCALAPDAVSDFARVERLAQRAVTGTEKYDWYRNYVLAKGLTDYRGGHAEQAVEWLKRLAPKPDGNVWDATAFAVLAMAQHRLGHAEQARTALVSAHALLAQKPDAQQWVYDWLHCEVLYREAEGLLGPVTLQELAANAQEAVRLRPDDQAARFRLASALAEAKQWDRSASVYAAALKQFGAPYVPGPWYAAIRSDEVFTRLTARQPEDRLPRIMQARLHVFQRDWKRAAADYARVYESLARIDPAKLLPMVDDDVFVYGCLLLLIGDCNGYEQFCKKWADRGGDSPAWRYGLARACGVSPRPVVPAQQIVEWAGQTVQADRTPWNLHVLSLAHYRNGELKLAIERAEESNGGNWVGSAKALNWLVLAMSYSRLGQAADARQSLKQAVELAGRASPEQLPGVAWPDLWPQDLVKCELLRREAEELINPKSSEKPDKKSG